jgi:hypothetical protein
MLPRSSYSAPVARANAFRVRSAALSGKRKKVASLSRGVSTHVAASWHAQPLNVPVVRDGAGNLGLQIDTTTVRAAEHTFAVQCGFARKSYELCELVFVQMNPFDDTKLARVALVRYSPDRFLERARQNEHFRRQIEGLRSAGSVPGDFTRLAQAAKPPSDQVPSAMVEAECEVMVRVGSRAAIVFFQANAAELIAADAGRVSSISLMPQLEVTMPVAALADLLGMWKEIAGPL